MLDRPVNDRPLVSRPTIVCALALAGLGGSSCFSGAEGRSPDPNALYFPTVLTVSRGGSTLYVANSDFDLRYSGGSVQAVDLGALRAAIRPVAERLGNGASAAEACAAAGRSPNEDTWLNPGPCDPFPYAPYVRAAHLIGAFASSGLVAYRADGPGARLFVPVRGDPSVTYFDVQDDRAADAAQSATFALDCAASEDGYCDTAHRVGQDPERSLRGVQLPADPMGVAATPDGRALVTVHQTQQAASLLVNDWDGIPELTYFTSSLATGPTEVVNLPQPALIPAARAEAAAAGRSFEYREGFLVSFLGAAEVDTLRFYPDTGATPPRPFLVRSAATAVVTNANNYDSRGLAVVDDERQQCEATCGTSPTTSCLRTCAEIPLKVFMANRDPAALLIGEVTTELDSSFVTVAGEPDPQEVLLGATETVTFYDSVPLAYGASRVEVGKVVDADGGLRTRVFAICFDSRAVFVVDPTTGQLEALIRTGRGPHDVAVDAGVDAQGEPHAFLLVGHFTDSYLGVVDLDMRRPRTYGQMIASVGTPTPPQESK